MRFHLGSIQSHMSSHMKIISTRAYKLQKVATFLPGMKFHLGLEGGMKLRPGVEFVKICEETTMFYMWRNQPGTEYKHDFVRLFNQQLFIVSSASSTIIAFSWEDEDKEEQRVLTIRYVNNNQV